MGFRLTLIFFIVAFAITVVESSSSSSVASHDEDNLSGIKNNSTGNSHGVATCNGLMIGDCMDDMEEMQMDSEASRRVLATRARSLSYEFLSKDKVPCSRRGASYYNCRKAGRANPYRRGCTVATRCARRTS